MANKVSKAFIKGHNAGYQSAKSWESKSELVKWVDSINRAITGTSKSSHSKDYQSGRKAGTKDYYKR